MEIPRSGGTGDLQRIAALRRLAILDTPTEAAFDRLTRLATRLLGVPVSLVSLVDEDRQFFKSCVGLPEPWASARETPLSHSFCQHAVNLGKPLVITDARIHPLVRDNLAIQDLGVIAYAGIPLVASDGNVLGTFCAIDHQPRVWTEDEVATLQDLALSVMTEIELRAAMDEIKRRTDRLSRLQSATAALSEALTPVQVADAVLDQGLAVLNTAHGLIFFLDEEARELRIGPTRGYDPMLIQSYHRLSIDLPLPATDAVRTHQPVFLSSTEEWLRRYPGGAAVHSSSGARATMAIPLLAEDRALGVLGFSFDEAQRFGDEDRIFILTLARLAAQALERSRLYASTLTAEAAAEEAREKLEFLLDASTTLAGSLDFEAALGALAQLAVPALADACVIDVAEDSGGIRRMVVVVADESDRNGVDTLRERAPHAGTDHPVARVIRTGTSELGTPTDALLQQVAADEQHLHALQSLGVTSYLCVPLIARDRIFGAMTMLSTSTRYLYADADLSLAEELARTAAAVVDNTRRYAGATQ